MEQLHSPELASQWLHTHVSGTLHTDSRKVLAGDGFIAWPGAAVDGRKFVQSALDAGAAACLVEADGLEAFNFTDSRVACYPALKAATGLIANAYYGQPSHALDVIAVTGTNGKTSTAWWVAQALNSLQYRSRSDSKSLSNKELLSQYSSGLIGTLGTGTPGNMVFNGLTTPDPVLLHAEFAKMRSHGAQACAIEASSIGLAEQRLAGTAIRVVIFTNFTQDHLDYHGTMLAYWESKLALFKWPRVQAAVVNLDDPKGEELAHYCSERGMQVWTASLLRTDARLWAQNIEYTDAGMRLTVCEGTQQSKLDCPVVGDYNVSNVLGVVAALRSLDIELADACQAVSRCSAVPGRMEFLSMPNAPMMVVDYAHTPDALEKVLAALSPMAKARGGQLWCVFGCGGDRDASKRPQMAQAAERGANKVVITSDNPRNEVPERIIAQIVAGLETPARAQIQIDRSRAIADTVAQAATRDVIVIAGKGHEDYQDIAGTKHGFSDIAHARLALQRCAEGT
jgi:UDP-N-acetylmuramyl-tripeptide synthetase